MAFEKRKKAEFQPTVQTFFLTSKSTNPSQQGSILLQLNSRVHRHQSMFFKNKSQLQLTVPRSQGTNANECITISKRLLRSNQCFKAVLTFLPSKATASISVQQVRCRWSKWIRIWLIGNSVDRIGGLKTRGWWPTLTGSPNQIRCQRPLQSPGEQEPSFPELNGFRIKTRQIFAFNSWVRCIG